MTVPSYSSGLFAYMKDLPIPRKKNPRKPSDFFPDVPPTPMPPMPRRIIDPVDVDFCKQESPTNASPNDDPETTWKGSYCYIAGLVGATYGFVYDDCVYLCIDFYENNESGNISVRDFDIRVYDKWLWFGGFCPTKIVITPPQSGWKDPYGRVSI